MNIDGILWGIALFIGVVAAFLDWKTYQVPNRLWFWGLGLATPFLLVELFTHPLWSLLRLGFGVLWVTVLFLLWRGQAFGGADLKGFALFGLLLSPVHYFQPHDGKFYPALDILVTSMLLAEIGRLLRKGDKFPLFSASSLPLLLVPVAGGLVWWPILWLLRFWIN